MDQRIFVSHSNHDNVWCREFVKSLRGIGYDVWFDEQDIPLGGRFPDIIGREIEQRGIFIIVLTPEAWQSDWVQKEIALAQADPHIIIPIVLRPTAISGLLRVQQHLNVAQMTPQQVAQRVQQTVGKVTPTHNVVAFPTMQQSDALISQLRRFPVYLLFDCSETMAGEAIIALSEGLELLHRELMSDPYTRETAWISLIRFANRAEQDALVPIDQFIPPTLQAGGKRSTGAALALLNASIREDLVVTTKETRGDYCPLVILLTDGFPDDMPKFRDEAFKIRQLSGSRRPQIVALGAGTKAPMALLAMLTDNIYLLHSISTDALRSFFQLVSGSISPSSR